MLNAVFLIFFSGQ